MNKLKILYLSNNFNTSIIKESSKNYKLFPIKFTDFNVDLLNKIQPEIIFLEPQKINEIKIFNTTLLQYQHSYLEYMPVFILTDNKKFINSAHINLNNYNIVDIPVTGKEFSVFVNIAKNIINNSKKYYQLKNELSETKQYLVTKIDNLLFLDYCLRKMAQFFHTEDIILNTLKILTNKKMFGFKEAYFYFSKEKQTYKYYKNNDNYIYETTKIPISLKKSLSSGLTKENNTLLIFPIKINNNSFGVFYIKKDKNQDQDKFLIAMLFLKEINLKIEMSELQIFTDELKKVSRSKDDFLTLVTHELKTPLSMILPSIEILTEITASDKHESEKEFFLEMLEGLNAGASRLHFIVNNILFYLSLTSEKINYSKIKSNPGTICHAIIESKQKNVETNKIKIINNISKKDNTIEIYPELFEKGIEIIIDNAIKFTQYSNNPVVKIASSYTQSHYLVTIQDNGIGIGKTEMKKLFKKFEILQDINKHNKGLGLNLNISKIIFERYHKGSINITSEKGKGTRVEICVPKK